MNARILTGRKALACAIASVTASLIFIPGYTQAQEGANAQAQEITVTGSRIRRTDGMAAPTPVTAVSPDELASYEPGATVAEQLDALPQFFGTQTAQRGGLALSGDAGASFLNMRSLGSNRTLVLLDGARMAPADKRGPVNVDTFPTALVSSVDIVTGGASAAYGADALGGVTNFIIDREFTGLKINTGTGITKYGDGFRWNASVAGGVEVGDKLNIIGSLEARQIDQIVRDPEDLGSWFRRWGHVGNPEWTPDSPPGVPRRLTAPWIAPTDRHVYGMISGTGTALDTMVFNREGTAVRPFQGGEYTSFSPTNASTSGGPEAELAHRAYNGPGGGAEAVGRSLFLAAKYAFTDNFSAYVQTVIGRSESNQKPERADTLGINLRSIWGPRIAVDNAYLPDEVRQIMLDNGVEEFTLNRDGAFLNQVDMGIDQRDSNVFTTETYTLGFDWDMPNDWHLSGNYSTGKTERRSRVENMMRVDRMFLAMDAVRDPSSGEIVCRVQLYDPTEEELAAAGLASGLTNSRTQGSDHPEPLASPIGLDNTVSECVPFNVMGFGNISPEAIEYVGTDKYSKGIVNQDFAEVVATGDLFDGWGYGPVSMALGLTWRESSFSDGAGPEEVDALGPPLNVPELGIRGIAPGYSGGSPNLHQFSTVPLISGEFDVWEWFTEVQAPLWESRSRAQRLSGSVAFRSSDYNLSGRSDSWKLGIEFQVTDGLRLRATQSRDVREASFSERFDAQGGGGNIMDPEQDDASYGITVIASGNPNLAPEVADTTVAGFVWQPTWEWAQGLSISGDWYEVNIEDAIQQIDQQDVVDRCFAGDVEQCANIERDPDTNNITRIFRRFFNQAEANVSGIDLEVAYRMEPNFFSTQSESLNVRMLAGYLLQREDISANGTVTDRTGAYSLPDLTANITTTYGIGPWSVQLQGRYIDSGLLNRTWVEGIDVDDNTVASSTWWNGTLRYSGELSSGAGWNVGLSVQNLFDRHMPVIAGGTAGAQGGFGANQYDTLGRRYNLSFNVTY